MLGDRQSVDSTPRSLGLVPEHMLSEKSETERFTTKILIHVKGNTLHCLKYGNIIYMYLFATETTAQTTKEPTMNVGTTEQTTNEPMTNVDTSQTILWSTASILSLLQQVKERYSTLKTKL